MASKHFEKGEVLKSNLKYDTGRIWFKERAKPPWMCVPPPSPWACLKERQSWGLGCLWKHEINAQRLQTEGGLELKSSRTTDLGHESAMESWGLQLRIHSVPCVLYRSTIMVLIKLVQVYTVLPKTMWSPHKSSTGSDQKPREASTGAPKLFSQGAASNNWHSIKGQKKI